MKRVPQRHGASYVANRDEVFPNRERGGGGRELVPGELLSRALEDEEGGTRACGDEELGAGRDEQELEVGLRRLEEHLLEGELVVALAQRPFEQQQKLEMALLAFQMAKCGATAVAARKVHSKRKVKAFVSIVFVFVWGEAQPE